MDFIGIDIHKNSSQVCMLTEDGELTKRRIKTDGSVAAIALGAIIPSSGSFITLRGSYP